jgi:hypothetical protein
MISTRTSKSLLVALAFSLVLAACGGDDDDATTTTEADAETSTTVGDATTTTAAPAETTTTAPADTTTAAPAETTTTAGGTTQPPSEALDRAQAKADAAAAVLPEDYTSATEVGDPESGNTDDLVFAECLDEGEFNIDELEGVTAAVVTMTGSAPLQDTGFPGPSASVEARVFDSESDAENAFVVLERIFGTEDGRACLADTVTEAMTAQMADEAEVEFDIEALDLEGADVGARVNMAIAIQGIDAAITIDLAATREGDLTTYGSFLGFGEEFPADLATALMTA